MIKYKTIRSFLVCFISMLCFQVYAQNNTNGKLAPKPLYVDPIYDGAADPVVIWNKKKKRWFMLYTNRRATINDTTGVKWVMNQSTST